MPRVTMEKLVEVSKDVYEVVTKTYEIPHKILVDNDILYYNVYTGSYEPINLGASILATDYIKNAINNAASKDEQEEKQA